MIVRESAGAKRSWQRCLLHVAVSLALGTSAVAAYSAPVDAQTDSAKSTDASQDAANKKAAKQLEGVVVSAPNYVP
ncbi:MAG: hypothetical protein JO278_00495, partial [Dyella sp.]|nr:hypothetical protein [Dyella sp.]